MKSIKEIRASVDSALDSVQAKLEATQVQAALGGMELEERFGSQVDSLRSVAEDLGGQLLKLTGDEGGERLSQAVDRLKVQLSLGRMESKDALLAMKAGLEERCSELNEAIDEVSGEAGEELGKAVAAYAEQAAKLKAEVEARIDAMD